jgi:hypothetical protein
VHALGQQGTWTLGVTLVLNSDLEVVQRDHSGKGQVL